MGCGRRSDADLSGACKLKHGGWSRSAGDRTENKIDKLAGRGPCRGCSTGTGMATGARTWHLRTLRSPGGHVRTRTGGEGCGHPCPSRSVCCGPAVGEHFREIARLTGVWVGEGGGEAPRKKADGERRVRERPRPWETVHGAGGRVSRPWAQWNFTGRVCWGRSWRLGADSGGARLLLKRRCQLPPRWRELPRRPGANGLKDSGLRPTLGAGGGNVLLYHSQCPQVPEEFLDLGGRGQPSGHQAGGGLAGSGRPLAGAYGGAALLPPAQGAQHLRARPGRRGSRTSSQGNCVLRCPCQDSPRTPWASTRASLYSPVSSVLAFALNDTATHVVTLALTPRCGHPVCSPLGLCDLRSGLRGKQPSLFPGFQRWHGRSRRKLLSPQTGMVLLFFEGQLDKNSFKTDGKLFARWIQVDQPTGDSLCHLETPPLAQGLQLRHPAYS